MKTRIFLVAAALMVFASLSFGQGFAVGIHDYADGPTTVAPGPTGACDGAPYPDGTVVWVYQDFTNNGPSADDLPASAGPNVGQVNFNNFPMNGDAYGEGTGHWVMDPVFTSVGVIPANPYYYLVIFCAGTQNIQWHSATFFLNSPAPQDIPLTSATWMCASCEAGPSCNPPQPPQVSITAAGGTQPQNISACIPLCAQGTTVVTICSDHALNPNNPPVSTWHPGCDLPCLDPGCTPGGAEVAGPFYDAAAGCWFYTLMGIADNTCFCFTFERFLAVGYNNDFAAVAMDNSVKLTWSTSSESNMSRYEIVRGEEVVGTVEAANTAHEYSFVDRSASNGHTYSYTLRSVGANNDVSELATVNGVTPSFGAAVITEYALHQNFPNPFNPTTEIAFDVLNANVVTLKVYNANGQEVATLFNGNVAANKRVVVNFDATNLTSGLYFYTVKMGNEFSATKKMLLVK